MALNASELLFRNNIKLNVCIVKKIRYFANFLAASEKISVFQAK